MFAETYYYLGIDWGQSMVGLALADNETRIANAYEEVSREKFIDVIKRIKKELDVRKIIIGDPEIMKKSGYSKDNIRDAVKMAAYLKNLGFQVFWEKEIFSTKLAQYNLSQTGKKGISKRDNAEAARIILQSWLDRVV